MTAYTPADADKTTRLPRIDRPLSLRGVRNAGGGMIQGLVCALVCALASAASVGGARAASDQPIYAPEPTWVRRLPIPVANKPSSAPAEVLLFTSQSRLAPDDNETFVETATRVNAPAGLQQLGNVIQTWNPSTETLMIHRAEILRNGKMIDLLAGGRRFTVIRRETNLEAATLDGELTATLQPEGLQIGDILHLAVTKTVREAALAGHSQGGAATGHVGSVGRLYVSVAWPAGRAFTVWKTDDVPNPTTSTRNGWTEASYDQTDAVTVDPPKDAPISDQLVGLLLAADFRGWADVSATSRPLYAKAETLAPESPLSAEIAKIRAASPDPKARALAALELVEGRVRYLALLMNAGGLTPAPADLTWSRRFGDCKGKTVLLLALLHGLGIEAEPALVNVAAGEALEHELPNMGAFDHVIVRAVISHKTYWLDATRIGDENLDAIPIENYRWALPVRSEGSALEPLAPPLPVQPFFESDETVDLTAGPDAAAPVHRELIFRGDGALAVDLAIKALGQVDADRALKKLLINGQDWIVPDKVAFAYDAQKMQGRATLDGKGTPPFSNAAGTADTTRDWLIDGSDVGYDADFVRLGDYHRDAPYAVAYPMFSRTTLEVKLPNGGAAFEPVNGDAVNRTTAGMAYARSASVSDGRFTMIASARAVAQSFPATEASADAAALHTLAEYSVSLRYTPTAKTPASPPEPASSAAEPAPLGQGGAANYTIQRAEEAFLAHQYDVADAGFSAAIAKAPSAKLYYDRAATRAALGEDAPAQTDLREALKLSPHDAFAEMGLGRYALRVHDMAEAGRLFAAAERDSADRARVDRQIASAYDGAKFYVEGYPYWRDAAASTTDAKARATMLNEACWARATAGADLPDARSACDASLAARPGTSEVLDSRGLVELRSDRPGKAIADYDAALAKAPDTWSSLYGRSVAERRLGRMQAADADAVAAEAILPNARSIFAKWGVDR